MNEWKVEFYCQLMANAWVKTIFMNIEEKSQGNITQIDTQYWIFKLSS